MNTETKMEMRTLLLGLGGTGCRIVDRVLGMIKESKTPDLYISCIGLDTDSHIVNDLKNGLEVIPISKEQTVENYLKNMPGWEEWFPDNPLIKKRNMIDGAGQMRPLSRLAFLESSSSGRIGKLEEAIKGLSLARGYVNPSNVRVMIVSSFAGGTGSGMFLHAAMWIRKHFRENYGGEVLIRGLFAFPDMYMATTDDDIQKESKYANAYGALRELNAVNMVTLCSSDEMREKAKKINISIDGYFDSKRDYAKANFPFNLMFFVDNINKDHRALPSLEHYEKLMANITYMQVYSPLSIAQYTAEDNGYIAILQSGGGALYGSAGASGLEYPCDDIMQYCALRAVSDSIGQKWTFFDNEFKKDLKENQDQRRANPAIPKLERDTSYINAVEAHMGDGGGQFRFIKSEVQDEDGRLITRRDETFFLQVMQLINSKFEKDEALEVYRRYCGVSTQMLSDPDNIIDEVSRVEAALRDYHQAIDEAVQRDKSSLTQAVICDAYESIQSFNNGENNVEKLLYSKDKAVHPLSARLLLYRFRSLVRQGLKAAENTFATCLTETSEYKSHDYNRKTKQVTEDAITEATRVSDLFAARFNPAFLAFKDDYFKMAGRQLKNLEQYCYCSLQKAVLADVLKRLDVLIGDYEIFFNSLTGIKAKLDADVSSLENKHKSDTDLTTYIYASPAAKRKIYNSLQINTDDEDSHEVNGAIFAALYKQACVELEDERVRRYAGETDEEKSGRHFDIMNDVFRTNVLKNTSDRIKKTYGEAVKLNVYEALSLQCAGDNTNPQDILASVAQKGLPYLLYDDQKTIGSGKADNSNYAYEYIFWGINPATERLILAGNPNLNGVVADFFKVGNTNLTPNTKVEERFSPYVIDFYRSSYGIRLKDIQKFSETGENGAFGTFYQNYEQRIQKMLAGGELAITPHLDIRWHLRSFLPYINSEKDMQDDFRAAEAMWLALAYGAITLREDAKGALRYYQTLNTAIGEVVEWDGTRLSANDTYDLFLAIKNNEMGILKALRLKDGQFAKEASKHRGASALGSKFAHGLISADIPKQNAVTMMYHFANDPEGPKAEFDTVKRALESLIKEFCAKASADSEVTDDLVSSIKNAIASVSEISNMPKTSMGYQLFSDWK